MPESNYQRLVRLAEEVFAVKDDPEQLDIDQGVIQRLQKIHHSNISEYNDGKGPVAWLLLIPTTQELMEKFLPKEISERELFEMTPEDSVYDSIYLCSALVLDEYRRKGIVKQLALKAIENIRKDHPVISLFVWPFTREGDVAAENIARMVSLPLYKR